MARKKSTKDTFAAYITQLAEDYAPKNIELQLAFRIGAQAAMKWRIIQVMKSIPRWCVHCGKTDNMEIPTKVMPISACMAKVQTLIKRMCTPIRYAPPLQVRKRV